MEAGGATPNLVSNSLRASVLFLKPCATTSFSFSADRCTSGELRFFNDSCIVFENSSNFFLISSLFGRFFSCEIVSMRKKMLADIHRTVERRCEAVFFLVQSWCNIKIFKLSTAVPQILTVVLFLFYELRITIDLYLRSMCG